MQDNIPKITYVEQVREQAPQRLMPEPLADLPAVPFEERYGGTVPQEIISNAAKDNTSTILNDMLAVTTLTDMVEAYDRNARRMEKAFSVMYKQRPTNDYPPDINERESVATDMHADRRAARDFLYAVRDGMKEQGMLTPQQEANFADRMSPRRPRRER